MLPGDAWIAGQRVRYLVEAGRTNDAHPIRSTECRATAGWCAALAGYAAHSAEQFAAADSAFAVALAAMDPTSDAAGSTSPSIVDDATGDRLHALDCDGRARRSRAACCDSPRRCTR